MVSIIPKNTGIMSEKDPRVDVYIEKAQTFAKPVLKKLRKLIFQACPDAIETIKWGFPNYEIHGSLFCNMAAFKEHCSFGFWKASLLSDPKKILHLAEKNAMGHFERISSPDDLPSDKILIAYLVEAAGLNKNNIKILRPKATPKEELPVPERLKSALKKNKKAQLNFEAFSSSQKREYIEWITEAKTEETADKRLATTIEWVAEGKTRLWKYKK
jgi:uncharacterized protein YdeI (YjbR/CyaY-like superfamily)